MPSCATSEMMSPRISKTKMPKKPFTMKAPMANRTNWIATGIRMIRISGATFSWNFFQPYDSVAPMSGPLDGGGAPNDEGGGGGGGGTSVKGTPPGAGRRTLTANWPTSRGYGPLPPAPLFALPDHCSGEAYGR